MRKRLVVIGIVVAVVLLVLALLPLLINANSFKPRVQDGLTKALGRNVTVGDLSASIYSGGITAKDITVADDPAFSQQPFVQAGSLQIGVDMGALIFSRKVKVRSLDLKSPQVHLLQNEAGRWNYSSLGGQKDTKSSHPGTQTSSGDEVSVDKLKIEGGSITIGRIGGPQRNYNDVGLTSSDLSYTTAFPFKVTAKTPGNGSLDIEGKAGPINQADAAATPLEASVSVKNLDMASTGFTDPKSGIAGTAEFTGKVQSDGKQVQSSGDVTIKQGKFTPSAQPSSVPMMVHYAANYDLASQKAALTTGTFNIGKASAQLTGTIDTHPNPPVLDMKLAGNGMALQELQDALPAFGVVLPPSAKLQSGTASANFQVTGTASNPATVGNASLNNAKLANFDLGSKLKGIGSLAGISSSQDTEIQLFAANVHNTLTGGTQVSDLKLVVPSIGIITGQGTISPSNALDFHLVVKLTNASVAGVLTQVAGVAGSNGIPVTVKGTMQSPQFMPDAAGLVKGLNPMGAGKSAAKGVGGVVGGLLGKKKPQ